MILWKFIKRSRQRKPQLNNMGTIPSCLLSNEFPVAINDVTIPSNTSNEQEHVNVEIENNRNMIDGLSNFAAVENTAAPVCFSESILISKTDDDDNDIWSSIATTPESTTEETANAETALCAPHLLDYIGWEVSAISDFSFFDINSFSWEDQRGGSRSRPCDEMCQSHRDRNQISCPGMSLVRRINSCL